MKDGTVLWRVILRVTPHGLSGDFDHVVYVGADSMADAIKQAEPTVGHYSFEAVTADRVRDGRLIA